MKKIISHIFSIVIIFSIFASFGTFITAEGDAVEAEIWSPAEIILESTREYENPYLDVEVDAVFTHSDGTVITIPGFWKEKNIFAVRFSPTKTGVWKYKITCNDAANPSLFKEGIVNAKETSAETPIAKHGFVKTQSGSKYFVHEDGTPFFWLGDTHWQAPNCVQTNVCNYPGCACYNQFKHEVDNRAEKGFTVYQTYFDTAESDGGGTAAIKIGSIWEEKLKLPSDEVFNKKIDYMFRYLHEKGMVIALGFGVHSATAKAMTLDEMKPFVRYIVGRYACYSIVWITAQEITRNTVPAKDEGLSVMDFWIQTARQVYALDGYKHPASAHMDVIEYADLRSFALQSEQWHTFWASQGGHGLKMLPAKKRYQAYCRTGEPVIEAEYNYEDINCGCFTGYDTVRYGAWNAYLNGLAGYTYGVTGIWANCYSTEEYTGWYGAFSSYNYEPWYIGLDKPGSYDMMYLKRFFMTLDDWAELVPRYSDTKYADFLQNETMLLASTEDASTFVAYFRNTDTSTGNIYKLDSSKTYQALWYNPITGRFIEAQKDIKGKSEYQLPPKPNMQDWVFLLTDQVLDGYLTEEVYSKPEKSPDTGNIITPFKVTAIGGISYSKGRIQDTTKYLYDLDGKSSWEPVANRTTQTIIYDLGTAYHVTQINLVPGSETTLPDYRIEGSLDNKNWTIIVNTQLHDKTLSQDGTYFEEALTGAYRYIKILLLNAQDIPDDEAAKSAYKLINNKMNTPAYYTRTAIAEITVFGTGKADLSQQNTLNEEPEIQVKPIPVIITAAVSVAVVVLAITLKAARKKKQAAAETY